VISQYQVSKVLTNKPQIKSNQIKSNRRPIANITQFRLARGCAEKLFPKSAEARRGVAAYKLTEILSDPSP